MINLFEVETSCYLLIFVWDSDGHVLNGWNFLSIATLKKYILKVEVDENLYLSKYLFEKISNYLKSKTNGPLLKSYLVPPRSKGSKPNISKIFAQIFSRHVNQDQKDVESTDHSFWESESWTSNTVIDISTVGTGLLVESSASRPRRWRGPLWASVADQHPFTPLSVARGEIHSSSCTDHVNSMDLCFGGCIEVCRFDFVKGNWLMTF